MTRDEFEQSDTPMVILIRYHHSREECYTEMFHGEGAFIQAIEHRETSWLHGDCSWDIIANDVAAAEYTETILEEIDMGGFDHGSTDAEQDTPEDWSEGYDTA